MALSKEQLWQALVARNPAFAGAETETVTLTKRGLRRMFEGAFEAGRTEGIESLMEEGLPEVEAGTGHKPSPFSDGVERTFFGAGGPFAKPRR